MGDLSARLARGESAAFAELYDRCGNQLHHYLVVRLGSREAAADVVQETFMRLARWHRRFESVGDPIAYAFAVARNEAARRWQSESRQVPRDLLSADNLFQIAGHDDHDLREMAEAVTQALARLNDEQREVVELKFFSGLTFREIAEVTSAPQGTVATRYRAALEKLRGLLAKEWS